MGGWPGAKFRLGRRARGSCSALGRGFSLRVSNATPHTLNHHCMPLPTTKEQPLRRGRVRPHDVCVVACDRGTRFATPGQRLIVKATPLSSHLSDVTSVAKKLAPPLGFSTALPVRVNPPGVSSMPSVSHIALTAHW